MTRPPAIVTFRINTLMAVAGALVADVEDAPRLEKFHAPLAERRNTTCGSSSRNDSTRRLREKMSGTRSTPMVTVLAVTNGPVLKPGSSAIDRF